MEISNQFQLSLNELLSSQLINQVTKDKIINEILELLSEKIYNYTGGDSSLSKEKTQMVINTIEYTISYYLQSLEINTALKLLSQLHIKDIYQQSHDYLLQSLHQLYIRVDYLKKNSLPIPIMVYKQTIQDGLSVFFKAYNFDYHTEDIILTLDYPTCRSLTKKHLEKMIEYVSYLEIEEAFLHCFPINNILSCLKGFCYYDENMIENISYIILMQCLCQSLINHQFDPKPFHYHELKNFYTIFGSLTQQELNQKLNHLLKYNINKLNTPYQNQMYHYYKKTLKDISSQLTVSSYHHTLDKILSLNKRNHDY